MARRLVRPPRSVFQKGDQVVVDGDASGPYVGRVLDTHGRLTKPISSYHPENDTRPGVTIRVTRWEGLDLDYVMDIVAWDSETRLRHREIIS